MKKQKIPREFDDFETELLEKQKIFLDKYNSENFILCNYNSLALKFLKGFLINKEINIFYLWGNYGIGKTHLIGILLDFYLNKNKENSAIYINCFYFINEYYKFFKLNDKFNLLEDIFWKFKLIIVDDFHLIKEKKKLVEIFSKIIKHAINNNIKIIFVLSSKNSLISKKNQKTLLNNSFFFKLNEPNNQDIKKIILEFIKKQNSNFKFTQESIDYLVEILGNNIHLLINKLMSILLLFENPSSLEIIDLKKLKKNLKKKNFFGEKVIFHNYLDNQQFKFICKKLNFDINEICSDSRKKNIVLNRNIIIYLLKTKINLTHEYIAKILNKNHSTITYSLKQINKKLKEKNFKKYIETIYENIF